MAEIELRPGDIYRWRYENPPEHSPYWCKSCIGVVSERYRLVDTYWGHSGDSTSFGKDDLDRLELEFVGNFADLQKTGEWNADYYADTDIVNLNHPNSNRDNFYIRKGAKKDPAKMLEIARYKREKSLSKIKSEQWYIERLDEAIAAIERGEVEGVHL